MIRIEDIVEKLQEHQPGADLDLVRRAYVFSAQHHKDQLRRSGEPYLIHPLEVAYILADMNLDATAVAVGLLHDVLEDTLVEREELERVFGAEVAQIVDGITKIGLIKFTSFEQKQAQNFRKLLIAMIDDARVILVKLADRLHNMRTLNHLEEHRRVRIARETLEIYVPIAHRLGMGRTKQELEDLCFLYLEPEKYNEIRNIVERELPAGEAYIRDVRRRMDEALRSNNIPGSIEWRIKGNLSIHRKRRRVERDAEIAYDFHDLIAFRIITDEVKHCYAALGIMHNLWTPVPGQFDDYIANPKMNNYQSLHTVLVDGRHRFEVQIRTREMHRIAEMGIASHWRYKGQDEGKDSRSGESWIDRYYQWMRSMLEWQEEMEDPTEFLSAFKSDLQPDEVFTFTPKGELLALLAGATPIDFAYAIHTDIGHTCVGAKVNGEMVPLDTKLRSGDTVEIVTSKGHNPSRDWLGIAKTGRARNKIRQFLNRQEKAKSIEVGRRLLEKELRRSGLSLRRAQGLEQFSEALKEAGLPGVDDLFSAVGFGRVSPRGFVARLVSEEEAEKTKEPLAGRIARAVKRTLGLGEKKIIVDGADDLLTYVAACCRPVYGEPIVGFVTRGKGVAVHRADCPNVADEHPERIIEVQWGRSTSGVMPAGIVVTTEDRQGILARIMARIDAAGINVRGLTAGAREDKTAEITMTLEVRDVAHLDSIRKSIADIDGVISIRRG